MNTQTQLSDFAIPEKIVVKNKRKTKSSPTDHNPYIVNEKEFKKMFKMRCATLAKKTPLEKEDIKALWEKVTHSYAMGFYCEYCGEFLSTQIGSANVFSFDHKNNDYSKFKIDEINIVCLGCNIFKRNISETNFKMVISLFQKAGKMALYDEIKKGFVDGLAEGRNRAISNGIACHRPRKDVDIDMIINQHNAGIPFLSIAKGLNISYSTLRNRLSEANILLEPLRNEKQH